MKLSTVSKAMAKGTKYYAVSNGRKPGVYSSWNDAKAQVDGYSGAVHKSFPTAEAARAWISENKQNSRSESTNSSQSYRSGPQSHNTGPRRYNSGKTASTSYDRPKPVASSSNLSTSGAPETPKHLLVDEKPFTVFCPSVFAYHPIPEKESADSSRIVIYTDGSCIGNGQYGARAGWGVYWGPGDRRNLCGRAPDATNNSGELEAIKQTLMQIKSNGTHSKYEIKTDSQYSLDSVTKWATKWEKNNWKTAGGGKVKNQNVIMDIRRLRNELKAKGVDVIITKVKGHSNVEGNEAADELARRGANM